jgi:hypothetical protein
LYNAYRHASTIFGPAKAFRGLLFPGSQDVIKFNQLSSRPFPFRKNRRTTHWCVVPGHASKSLGEEAVRRILGVLNLTKKYGVASTDEACALGLETGASHYHFVRRYLERNPQLPLSLRQVDPLIRQLSLYRDLIESRIQDSKQENPS